MGRNAEHDGEGIIGERPKRKDLRAQLEGLSLFDLAAPEGDCGYCGKTFAADEPKLIGPRDIGAVCHPCAEKRRREVVDIIFGDPDAPNEFSGDVIHASDAGAVGAIQEPDDNPTDPTKPPAPTDAERLVAIERVKAAIVDDLIRRAEHRKGLPLAQAGVTADDAHELAMARPEAVLVGGKGRAWSWLGPWLAALARRGELAPFRVEGLPVTRRSTRDKAHGNAHAVYLHPLDPRSPGQPRAGLASAS